MSGFEVAGVVLGTIPLVISALEQYQKGISTMRKWRNYQRELRSLIWNLETERIESMVEDPFGPAWHEDTIQAKIKTRLWRSFSVFENTIKEIEKATKEMMTQLNVQSGGNVSISSLEGSDF
ncbi:hypothetical protein K4K61_000285 [Colletotrichum sp. SAR11_59]|nr:hypothetical protein K4K61_000285 [Colletotrichum sp. SAR11_59]